MEEIRTFLENHGIGYTCDKALSRVSAMALGGRSRIFATPASEPELIKLIEFLSSGKYKYKVVGRMTNLLPPDGEYNGIIVSTEKLRNFSLDNGILTLQCGVSFSKIAKKIAKMGYGGIAQISGIPGTVGGMVYSNAGAFGLEIKDILIDARCYSVNNGEVCNIPSSDMGFSYRRSVLSRGGLILLSARFALKEQDPALAASEILRVSKERRDKQPTNLPSLGSAFLRPDGHYAAKLIDDAGLRGYSIGGAAVSKKHAGFIVNTGGATAEDVKRLIEYIREQVLQRFGVLLIPEIELLE